MATEIFWIKEIEPLRLAMMPRPRPRPGDWLRDEIAGWQAMDVGTVVSLLESHEMWELSLQNEEALCAAHGIEFLSFPMPDRGLPKSVHDVKNFVDDLVSRLKKGGSVLIHCRAGIGRSGLLAGCILVSLGVPFPDVFPLLCQSRKLHVPDTQGQIDWVRVYAEKLPDL